MVPYTTMSSWYNLYRRNNKTTFYMDWSKAYGHNNTFFLSIPVKDEIYVSWETLCVDLIDPYTIKQPNK